MKTVFDRCFPALAAAWLALAQEPLLGWVGIQPHPDLPRELNRLIYHDGFESPAQLRDENGQPWLVARAGKSAYAARPMYLASRDPGGRVGTVLMAWASLLEQLAEEQTATTELTAELLSAWNRLNFVFEMAQIVGRHSEFQPMVQSLAQSLQEVIPAEDVWLALRQDRQVRIYNASGQTISSLDEILEKEEILAKEEMPARTGPEASKLLILDRESLPPRLAAENPTLRNLIMLPLLLGQPGMLGLVNHPTAALTSGDQQLLFSAAEQLSAIIDAALARVDQEANRRLDHELAIATQIQLSMLPPVFPKVPGLEFAARLLPAHRVGGDFYDVQPIPGGLILMVSDVAGKGVPAAIVTALLHATLKSEAQRFHQPAALLRSINQLIYDELDRAETFVTASLAVLRTGPFSLSYASAGHTTTLLWRLASQDVVQLTSTGLPLGLVRQMEIAQHEVAVAPGDVLLLYSDGVTEAENSEEKVFGLEALIDVITAVHPAAVADQLQAVLKAVDLHRGNLQLRDDVVLLMAHVFPTETRPILGKITPFVYAAEKQSTRAVARLARSMCEELYRFATPAHRTNFLDGLELAVSEIVTNIVVHACRNLPGRIQGRITGYPDRVRIDLIDSGIEFPNYPGPLSRSFSPQDPPAGGYGLGMARRLLSSCEYTRLPNHRNHWRLEKVAHNDVLIIHYGH